MVFVLKIVKATNIKEEKKIHSAIQNDIKTSKNYKNSLSSSKDTKDFLDLSGGILGI